MSAAALILAAGRSQRFGATKLLTPLRGSPLITHAIRAAADAGLGPIVVVTGHDRSAIRAALGEEPPIVWVHNPRYEQGQATSLRAGLLALTSDLDVEVAVVLLGDEPDVQPDIVREVAMTARQYGRGSLRATHVDAVRARYLDGAGHPVAFPRRAWWRVLATSSGDAGARHLLAEGQVIHVDVPRRRPIDVDRPADLRRLTGSMHGEVDAPCPQAGSR